jgi:SAM-dependent methyltransferase
VSSDTWQFWYTRKEGTVEPEIPMLENFLRKSGGSKVLDFGCGAGRHTIYFVRKGFEVYGFDVSRVAIRRARELLKKENLSANLMILDMTKPLPYQGAYFDAILAVRVMHHTYVKNIKSIANEIDRVLKTGGYLFLQVPSFSRAERLRRKREGWKFEEPEPRTYVSLDGEEKGIPHHHFTKNELLALFKNYSTNYLHKGTKHHSGYCFVARKK